MTLKPWGDATSWIGLTTSPPPPTTCKQNLKTIKSWDRNCRLNAYLLQCQLTWMMNHFVVLIHWSKNCTSIDKLYQLGRRLVLIQFYIWRCRRDMSWRYAFWYRRHVGDARWWCVDFWFFAVSEKSKSQNLKNVDEASHYTNPLYSLRPFFSPFRGWMLAAWRFNGSVWHDDEISFDFKLIANGVWFWLPLLDDAIGISVDFACEVDDTLIGFMETFDRVSSIGFDATDRATIGLAELIIVIQDGDRGIDGALIMPGDKFVDCKESFKITFKEICLKLLQLPNWKLVTLVSNLKVNSLSCT